MFNKVLLVSLITFFSIGAHAQGMFVSKYGSIVTIDQNGGVWDATKIAYGIGFIPKYEVKLVGRNYLVSTKDRVYKTDVNGYLYDDVLNGDKIRGGDIEIKGDNYFITKRGGLYSFSDFGGEYHFEKSSKYRPDNILLFGKEFFITKESDGVFTLFLIKKDGTLQKNSEGQYLDKVVQTAGSNYFFNLKNNLSVFGVDGKAIDKSMLGNFSKLKSLKGNYFINDKAGLLELWTINKYSTVINQGDINKYIKSSNLQVGPNYVLDKEQKNILVIDMENNKVIVRDLEKILE